MITVASAADLDLIRALFREYRTSVEAPECFTAFEREVEALPDGYFAILLAGNVGCVALRELAPGTAEMKRLYIRPSGRGRGLGRKLVEASLEHAKNRGYGTLRLDTLETMSAAIALYRSMGFTAIERYNNTPGERTLFYEKRL
ncbi:MAG: GNAT family N-acetyltransferase [Bryobacteraceae bacterium]|nr:GNAT family N-acetyltransferase [Bryobacteraceae bacterium]